MRNTGQRLLPLQPNDAVFTGSIGGAEFERDLLGTSSHVTLTEELTVRFDQIDLVDLGPCESSTTNVVPSTATRSIWS